MNNVCDLDRCGIILLKNMIVRLLMWGKLLLIT